MNPMILGFIFVPFLYMFFKLKMKNLYNFKNRIFIIFRLYKRPKKKAMPLFNSEIA
ncbi:hypothetical protein HMPREF1208_00254 [Staphylococcus sp. HGB0015]|uniref:Uncharacterized protein n=1 Tax=Staphylococcus schleiferi TaxID=1295 RepID=A0A7Z7QRH1_STASC|nr:hypothetical protein HMPREF1208_00254 [Staphylococcus sp. HGB0015]CAD7360413.1 Uncharacterised protein [Staphylococcus schleiferi]SUM89965.1 Uncharacterised protein [Staphylococcus schleiferi]